MPIEKTNHVAGGLREPRKTVESPYLLSPSSATVWSAAFTLDTPAPPFGDFRSPLIPQQEKNFARTLEANNLNQQSEALSKLVALHIQDSHLQQRRQEIQKIEKEIAAAKQADLPHQISCPAHWTPQTAQMSQAIVDPALAARARFLNGKLQALQHDQKTAADHLENTILQSLRLALGLPEKTEWHPNAFVMGIIGDHLENAGESTLAAIFFQKAAESAEVVADHAWYQLRALQQIPQNKLTEKIPKIESIREELATLSSAITLDQLNRESSDNEAGEVSLPKQNLGTPQQIYLLEALSWGLLYDAHWSASSPDFAKIAALEEDRRASASQRTNNASFLETKLHVGNLTRTAIAATMPGGKIESLRHGKGLKAAQSNFDQLAQDIHVVTQMTREENAFSDDIANLQWQLRGEGSFSLDQPKTALKDLTEKVIPVYPHSVSIARHLQKLQNEAPHLFDSKGKLNPDVDVSATELGQNAAMETRSAYWMGNDSARNTWLPIATGAVGALGGFAMGNVPGAVFGGGLASAAGTGGNTLYNLYNEESVAAIHQSLETGLSRVDPHEGHLNRTLLGWSFGFSVLNGAMLALPAVAVASAVTKTAEAGAETVLAGGGLKALLLSGSKRGMQATLQVARHPFRMTTQAFTAVGEKMAGATDRIAATTGVSVGQKFQNYLNNIPGGPGQAALRMFAGSSLVAADYASNGKIDNALGAVGAAIFVNEGAFQLMRVDANGMLIGTLFRVGTEWAMQIQQDMPIQQPGLTRMVISSAESVTMVFFVKTMVRGDEFLTQFPIGRGLMRVKNGIIQRFPWTDSVLSAITNRGTQTLDGFAKVTLTPGGNNGNLNGQKVFLTPTHEVVISDGTRFPLAEARLHLAQLNANGVTVETTGGINKLVYWIARERSTVRIGGEKLTRGMLLTGEQREALQNEGISVLEDGRFQKTDFAGVHFTGVEKVAGQIQPTFDELTSPPIISDSATIGGTKLVLWKGTPSRPKFTPLGASLVALHTAGTAYLLNRTIFSKLMNGDPDYQPMQRATNYWFSEMVTHPYVQWPLGYDKWRGQTVGRTIGIVVNLAANKLFPTYRDQWPGQGTYFQALQENRLDDAFENFTDNMTSFELVPGFFEDSAHDVWLWEPPALQKFRKTHDEKIQAHDQTLIENLSKMFTEQVEKERRGNLSTVDRRALRILAAYITRVLADDLDNHDQNLDALRTLKTNYPMLFDNVPILVGELDWKDFTHQVNHDTDPAHGFHLYLK